MTSEINKRAWHIRRITAKKYGIGVMDVMWGVCLDMARTVLEMENKAPESLIIHQTWRELRRRKETRLVTPLNAILLALNIIVWYGIGTM